HSPMLTEETTPPSVPASSPELRMYFAPFTIGIWPSVFTLLGPPVVSEDLPMFGYGIGTGLGAAGVLHTSGNTMLSPPLPLCAMPRAFTNVVCAISSPASRLFQLLQHDPREPALLDRPRHPLVHDDLHRRLRQPE